MKYTKEMNDGRHVFVFGSNTRGIHGAGAALEARRNWGARIGCGLGRTGDAYAIATKGWNLNTLPLTAIDQNVSDFIRYAKEHPELVFLVTAIGCGLAGYAPKEIAPMFKNAPKNCVLPDEFTPEWFKEMLKPIPKEGFVGKISPVENN